MTIFPHNLYSKYPNLSQMQRDFPYNALICCGLFSDILMTLMLSSQVNADYFWQGHTQSRHLNAIRVCQTRKEILTDMLL